MFKKLLLAALPAFVLSQSTPDLATALGANANLSTLAGLVKSQPQLLQSLLTNAKNITILAPNNAALNAVLNATGSSLASDPGAVAALLSYHVLNGTYYSSQIKNISAFIPTLLTNSSYANVTGGQVVESILGHGNVSVISGLLQNSTVVQADQNFTGGTIHVINKVLTIPTKLSVGLIDAKLTAAYGALNATKLISTVDGLKDITIFAPNDTAFQNIASLFQNASTSDLTKVLEYHVVNASKPLYSSTLSNTTVGTLIGTNLTVTVQNGSVFVNNAKVIVPDLLVAGGVVHIIDQVLNPSNATAKPSGTAGAVAFPGVSSASSLPFTSGVPTPAASTGGGAAAATSTSKAAAAPMKTAGAMGAAALFGAVLIL